MSLGSLLTKIGKGGQLAPSEQAELERLSQGLDDTLYRIGHQAEPNNDVLPTEAAILADDGLSVATGQGDQLPAWDTALADTFTDGGMEVDLTNGYIYVNRLPRNAIVGVFYDVDFSKNASGWRYVELSTNLTDPIHVAALEEQSADYPATICGVHFMRLITDLQWVKMIVGHTSSGTLTINSRFMVLRLR